MPLAWTGAGLVVGDRDQDVVDRDRSVARRLGVRRRAAASARSRVELAVVLEDLAQVAGARETPLATPPV